MPYELSTTFGISATFFLPKVNGDMDKGTGIGIGLGEPVIRLAFASPFAEFGRKSLRR